MFKNILKTGNKITKRHNFFNKLKFNSFSTNQFDLYPDQVIEQVRTETNSSGNLSTDLESNIMEHINFLDADQFVDMVSMLAYSNKGTEALWDILSRKVFDYELDLAQTFMLDEALMNCSKQEHFMEDQIARDSLVWETKWKKESKVFKQLL